MLPVLNAAGVDLMISGHHHKYIYTAPGAEGNRNAFPILINSNTDRLDCVVSEKQITARIFNEDGKEVHSLSFKK